MTSEKLKKGDVVRLKSGSPLMTVAAIEEISDDRVIAKCHWFEGGNVKEYSFELESIEKVEPIGHLMKDASFYK